MASGKIKELDAFHVGDSYNFGNGACFIAYLSSGNNGTMYVCFPKTIGSDITGAEVSWTACNWVMRPNQALSQNFSVSAVVTIGGNQMRVDFTTNVSSSSYYLPVLINLSGLTFTFI